MTDDAHPDVRLQRIATALGELQLGFAALENEAVMILVGFMREIDPQVAHIMLSRVQFSEARRKLSLVAKLASTERDVPGLRSEMGSWLKRCAEAADRRNNYIHLTLAQSATGEWSNLGDLLSPSVTSLDPAEIRTLTLTVHGLVREAQGISSRVLSAFSDPLERAPGTSMIPLFKERAERPQGD